MARWPKEHEDKLRELWSRNYTGTEIAEELEPLPATAKRPPQPVNRDMVISKARRMGLPGRASPIQPRD